ncbi:MAG: lipoyl synthase [Chlamydiales bacterium]
MHQVVKPKSRLNVLPDNPQESDPKSAVALGRFPKWLHRKLPQGNALWQTSDVLKKKRLSTVCEEAKCPNLLECWSQKTATFLAMGKECTRNCGFCDIDFSTSPKPLELDEPQRIAESVVHLGLKHVVITMVARDDLSDGGAAHIAAIVRAVHALDMGISVEVLTSDFEKNWEALDAIIEAKPEIFNHNIETTRSLSVRVRHKASYQRTLDVLRYASRLPFIKSGLMVGLGESREEVEETIRDLRDVGVKIITIGQYLQPNRKKLRVKEFVTPQTFEEYAAYGRAQGVPYMYTGPFVRSSYNAASLFELMRRA